MTQKTKFTRIETMVKAAKELNLTPITGAQLWDLQDKLLTPSPEFTAAKTVLLKSYHHSPKSWAEYLSQIPWYSGPKGLEASLNNAIKNLCKLHNVHNPCYTYEYLFANLSHSTRSKHVTRERINGLFHYSFNL